MVVNPLSFSRVAPVAAPLHNSRPVWVFHRISTLLQVVAAAKDNAAIEDRQTVRTSEWEALTLALGHPNASTEAKWDLKIACLSLGDALEPYTGFPCIAPYEFG